jgi:hypothetical protein
VSVRRLLGAARAGVKTTCRIVAPKQAARKPCLPAEFIERMGLRVCKLSLNEQVWQGCDLRIQDYQAPSSAAGVQPQRHLCWGEDG